MKYLIDFIETKDVKKTLVYKHLKCTKTEADLLQYVCRRYVKGMEEVPVLELLQVNFSENGYAYLKKLELVKNLIDLGWFIQMSFGQVKAHDPSQLELLNTSVTPSISLLRLLKRARWNFPCPRSSPTPTT